MLNIKIVNAQKETVEEVTDEREAYLYVRREYKAGDKIIISHSEEECFLWIQLDEAIGKALVIAKGQIEYEIPMKEQKTAMTSKAFSGDRHLISVRYAREYEKNAYRNIALNPYDQNKEVQYYPHVTANVETRGEAAFAAYNVIDGVTANKGHGAWPHTSWGINQRKDARVRIDFGRKIKMDRIVMYMRADFPHDSWWTSAEVLFSDGSSMIVELEKGAWANEFEMPEKEVEWIEVCNLVKADDPSPFPSMTQIEVYGRDLENCV